jgi:hypothetical protein
MLIGSPDEQPPPRLIDRLRDRVPRPWAPPAPEPEVPEARSPHTRSLDVPGLYDNHVDLVVAIYAGADDGRVDRAIARREWYINSVARLDVLDRGVRVVLRLAGGAGVLLGGIQAGRHFGLW